MIQVTNFNYRNIINNINLNFCNGINFLEGSNGSGNITF